MPQSKNDAMVAALLAVKPELSQLASASELRDMLDEVELVKSMIGSHGTSPVDYARSKK